MENIGTVAIGVKAPIIKEGDDIFDFVIKSLETFGYAPQDGDIIGITESVVARSLGMYATVDDIANDIRGKFLDSSNGKYKTGKVILHYPIYSRNRFATILRGIARAAEEMTIIMPEIDEVGNVRTNHPFTRENYDELYSAIAGEERVSKFKVVSDASELENTVESAKIILHIDCRLHNYSQYLNCVEGEQRTEAEQYVGWYHLIEILHDKSYFGVLGSNVAGPEKIKLFPCPKQCQALVDRIQEFYQSKHNVRVQSLVYGDGCFHSPELDGIVGTSINEFADPVTSPGYTDGLSGGPNELKIKAIVDTDFKNLSGKELEDAVKSAILEREQFYKDVTTEDGPDKSSIGTTPRRYVDSVVSLCDLITGSGQKGTPIVVIQNYFSNYAN